MLKMGINPYLCTYEEIWRSNSMPSLDFEIFEGKTFRDLCKDVITRSESKKDQLDTLLADCRGHIKNINDAQVFLPRIKELLEVGIKNDEQLIKLSSVLQKLQSTQLETSGGEDGMLSEDEKEQLLKNSLREEIKDIQKNVAEIVKATPTSVPTPSPIPAPNIIS